MKKYIKFLLPLLILAFPCITMVLYSNDSIVASLTKKLAYLIFSFSFILVGFSFVKPKKLFLFYTPIILLAFVEAYVILQLRASSSSGIFSAMIETNNNEATEFLFSIWPYLLFSFLAIVIYYYCVFNLSANLVLSRRLRLIVFTGFVAVQFLILSRDIYIANKVSSEDGIVGTVIYFYTVKLKKSFPINWGYNILGYLEGRSRVKKYESNVNEFKFGSEHDAIVTEDEVYVLVIGETARRNNFSLYGYHRLTNPLLEKQLNLVAFTNAISTSNLTSLSYPQFVTRATPETFEQAFKEPSILKAFKEVGFKTFYMSNQKVDQGSVYSLYANQADTLVLLNSSIDMPYDDSMIFSPFDKILDDSAKRKFIMVHTLGSHFRYNLRYPKEFSHFRPEIPRSFSLTSIDRTKKDVFTNSYDNSILFTDFFLNSLIERLKAKNIVSTLLYASDHGESLYDNESIGFGHGSSNPSSFEMEIPFMVWYSDLYKTHFGANVKSLNLNKTRPISTNNIFHTTIDLANITIDNETKLNSLGYDKFTGDKQRSVLLPDMTIVSYEEDFAR